MHQIGRKRQSQFLAISGLALAMGLGVAALADEGHKHGAPLHGGKVAMTKEYHFEVVFAKGGLKVYPRTHEDEPVDASRLIGTATFYHPNSSKPWFERTLAASPASPGRAVSSLGTTIDLSKVPATGAKVEFRVAGLPEAAEPSATFTVPFAIANSGELIVTQATASDQAAIKFQRVCRVSGEELGSMGAPIKVTRGSRSTLLCCKGCLKDLKADPDKYLGASANPDADKDKHGHQGHNH